MKTGPMFIISRPNWLDPLGYSIRFAIRYDDGRIAVARDTTLVEVKKGEPAPEGALLRLESGHEAEAALQSLFDQLWALGFRPSDIGMPGHLEATKEHLKDMRALVSRSYGVEL